jgi:zinc transporter 1/2/3
MNCPSRNDNVLMNTGWNQSPPRFAADLTTCADLNGIANNRELGDADRLCNGSRSLRHVELEDRNIKEVGKVPLEVGKGAKGSLQGESNFAAVMVEYRNANHGTGPCTRTTTPVFIEHRAGLFQSWATWLLSVLATSTVLSYMSGNMPSFNFTMGKKSSAKLATASKAGLGFRYYMS